MNRICSKCDHRHKNIAGHCRAEPKTPSLASWFVKLLREYETDPEFVAEGIELLIGELKQIKKSILKLRNK